MFLGGNSHGRCRAGVKISVRSAVAELLRIRTHCVYARILLASKRTHFGSFEAYAEVYALRQLG